MRRGPAPSALLVYGALSLLTLGIAFVRDNSPIETEAWLSILPLWSRHVLSAAGGGALAVGTVRATRLFVGRWGWAKSLHSDLRPVVRDAGDGTIFVVGLASGVAEELFFRGLLTPLLGLALSSVAFGALHQLRGRAGWFWTAWAAIMGLLFGALFLVTGSLVGPILAHVAINIVNLRFLRDTDVEPRPVRELGGLLGRG
ncbi:MAG: CPBP family intramembrane metalloprotease [Labilithrix sp.]|nr:CPBP family intramembrane metalloprotease [Labilithrix sp.]